MLLSFPIWQIMSSSVADNVSLLPLLKEVCKEVDGKLNGAAIIHYEQKVFNLGPLESAFERPSYSGGQLAVTTVQE